MDGISFTSLLVANNLNPPTRFSKENFPNILKLADGLKEIGAKHNATAGQICLAWLLGQGNDVIPIPGTTKIKVRNIAVLLLLRVFLPHHG